MEEETTIGFTKITQPKYYCPRCGVVDGYIDITIDEYVGKYCLKCYARWVKKAFPKLTLIH